MKFDLALFRQLNDEYQARRLVAQPPKYDPDSLADRAKRKADTVANRVPVQGKRILEIGCGRGEMCRTLNEIYGCEAVGVDVTTYKEWKQEVPGVRLIQTDLSASDPVSLGDFDVVYSNSVWEHLRHPFTMLERSFDVLKPGGRFLLKANLYRGPKASHRYREVFFPWPHLLFTDEVFEEYYVSIGKPPKRPAWVNQLSIADYLRYFDLVGFKVEHMSFSRTPIDEPFYQRFADKLERFPKYDLERDFINVVLEKPAPS